MRERGILLTLCLIFALALASAEVLIQNKNLHIDHGNLLITGGYVGSPLIPSSAGTALGSTSNPWLVYASDVRCSNCITLGSETNGNYVAGIAAGNGISIVNGSGEGVTPLIAVKAGTGLAFDATGNLELNTSYTDARYVNVTGDTMTGTLTLYDGGRAAGSKFLVVGDDVYLTDIDHANTLGIYGNQDSTQAHVKLGSNGPKLSGVAGKLGINNTSPAYTLDVSGGARSSYVVAGTAYSPRNTSSRIIIPGPTSDFSITVQDGTGRVQFYWNSSPGTSPTYLVSNEAAGKILFNPASSAFFQLFYAPAGAAGSAITWSEKFRVDTSGYAYAQRFVDLGNTSYYVDPANAGTSAVFAGKVGIGTTTPAYALDVSGDIRATGQIIAGDLVFKNGFRVREDGNDALVLLNPRGTPILRIDANGNVWIIGTLRRWS